MLLQRPSSSASMRPAYLDNLYRDYSTPPSPNVSSADSSSSYNSSAVDLRSSQPLSARPLPPFYEEDAAETESIRSLRPTLSPRFRNLFNRRTFPQAKETSRVSSTTSSSTTSLSTTLSMTAPAPARIQLSSRRPSLPRIQTSFSSPARKAGSRKENVLPPLPAPPAKEITCHRCYYFAARHCNGWVMDGSHGDACEQCLVRFQPYRKLEHC